MTLVKDWMQEAANEIDDIMLHSGDVVGTDFRGIIAKHCPFKDGVLYDEHREPPLLQCVDCNNTESCAGAMAREHWHPGRCMHCGGAFKVIRA